MIGTAPLRQVCIRELTEKGLTAVVGKADLVVIGYRSQLAVHSIQSLQDHVCAF